jgi:GDP-L-fucose synthase
MANPKKPSSYWKTQRVLVTGGAGFLGSFVVEQLRTYGCPDIVVPRSKETDLRQSEVIDRLLGTTRPTTIIHLAAVCGGIGANQAEPGRFFYDNAIMGIQLMEYARRHKVPKFVQVGTVCAYPKFTPTPFKEADLWNGYPEETNAPYGLAKKMLLVQAQAYRAQYGFNAIYLLPANLYGPRDNFDLETSHVIPALIRKFVEAQEKQAPSVTLWGSGSASRDFFYVEDAAEGILLATEKYNQGEPANLGTGVEIKIKDLAEMIRQKTDFRGKIVWDTRRPDGQPRRMLSIEQAEREFGFRAPTSIDAGLDKTIQWFRQHQSAAAA